MQTITKRDIVAELKAVAASKPGHIQPQSQCKYAQNGGPGCIVGTALRQLGVPLKTLRLMDSCALATISNSHVQDVLRGEGFRLTPGAITAAREVQRQADMTRPWGVAVREGLA